MNPNQTGNNWAQKNDPSQIYGHPTHRNNPECGAYTLTDETSNKVYVGSTTNLHRRKIQHLSNLCRHEHPNAALQATFEENKRLRLDFYPVPEGTPAEQALPAARAMEEKMLKEIPKDNLLNVSTDPYKPMVGISPTEETRARISSALVGRPKPFGHRENVAKARTGTHLSETCKGNISTAVTKYAVEVNGVSYPNAPAAAKALGISGKAEVRRRCLSDKYPTWRRTERTTVP